VCLSGPALGFRFPGNSGSPFVFAPSRRNLSTAVSDRGQTEEVPERAEVPPANPDLPGPDEPRQEEAGAPPPMATGTMCLRHPPPATSVSDLSAQDTDGLGWWPQEPEGGVKDPVFPEAPIDLEFFDVFIRATQNNEDTVPDEALEELARQIREKSAVSWDAPSLLSLETATRHDGESTKESESDLLDVLCTRDFLAADDLFESVIVGGEKSLRRAKVKALREGVPDGESREVLEKKAVFAHILAARATLQDRAGKVTAGLLSSWEALKMLKNLQGSSHPSTRFTEEVAKDTRRRYDQCGG